MENVLMILGIAGILVGIYFLYKYLQAKGLGREQMDFIYSLLNTLDFVSQEFDLGYSEQVIQVVEIMTDVLSYVEEMDKYETYTEKKNEIIRLTQEICLREDIDFGDKLIFEVMDRIADYFIAQDFKQDLSEQQIKELTK